MISFPESQAKSSGGLLRHSVQPGELAWVLAFGAVLLGNSLATQVSGIVALGGFLSNVGVVQMIPVWIADYSVLLGLSNLEAFLVDRFERRKLIGWISLGFALTFVALRLLFVLGAPPWLSYALLYLVSDQQRQFFPLIYWALAGDTYNASHAMRLFPVLSSFGWVGTLVGISAAGSAPFVLGWLGVGLEDVLLLNVLVYVILWVIARGKLAKLSAPRKALKRGSLREQLAEGKEFVTRVPAFKYLTFATLAIVASDIILEFRFYDVTDAVFAGTDRYVTFYSLYRLAFTVGALVVEGLLARRVIQRLGLKNSFFVLPICALLGGVWMLVAPGLPSAVGGVVLQKLPQGTVDETARKDLQTLIPEERRGRVAILMDLHMYASGSILGALLLGVVVVLQFLLHGPALFGVYLVGAICAAGISLWSILNLRRTYDASLWSGRLTRRKRTSALLERL